MTTTKETNPPDPESNSTGTEPPRIESEPGHPSTLVSGDAPEDKLPLAGETTTPAKSQKNTPARQKLWGMPRRIGIAVIAGLGAVLLAAGAIVTSTTIQRVQEERAEIEAHHAEASSRFSNASEEFSTTKLHVEQLVEETSPKDLGASEADGERVIDSLQGAFILASERERLLKTELLEVEGSSSAELQRNTSALTSAAESLDMGAADLQTAIDTIESAREEQARAVAEAERLAALAAKKAAAIPTTFEDLFRAGDSVMGSYFQFEGKIIQDAGSGTYRVSMTKDPGYSRVFWKDPILVSVTGEPNQRLLEDDIITFVGSSLGVQSYESIFKQSISLPLISVAGADITVTGRDG